jgi:glycosyltransferase involved in cell wall biosynthesis
MMAGARQSKDAGRSVWEANTVTFAANLSSRLTLWPSPRKIGGSPIDSISRPDAGPIGGGRPPLRIAWVYDMDACRGPTGVTRHALAQLEQLARRPDIDLRVVSGRIREPDGLLYWESLGELRRRELPVCLRHALRFWRMCSRPPLEWWSGAVDWVYCPAEYAIPTSRAKRAVTSHDVLQDLRYGGPRRRQRLASAFAQADMILSVSRFNTHQLLDAFPECRGRTAYVPNGAEDLFFEPASEAERLGVRADLDLPKGMPYLLSVANFQPRKNLVRLTRAAGSLPEVANGELALVLLGDGSPEQAAPIREAIAAIGRKAIVKMPGYRQGKSLRAIYAEAKALVFPSTCESFGIPAVEAMAQGCPVALADNTALPEVGGDAAWYFGPEDEPAIAESLRSLLHDAEARAARTQRGYEIAGGYRWQTANERLIAAFRGEGLE